MKRLYLVLIFLTFSIFAFAREYKVYGPQGGLAMEVTLPDHFNDSGNPCLKDAGLIETGAFALLTPCCGTCIL